MLAQPVIAPPARAASAQIQVVASGFDQPKKITFAPDGSLVVAESGDGVASSDCIDGSQQSCIDASGEIDDVTLSGQVTPLATGLPSAAGGSGNDTATGPVEALEQDGQLDILFQNTSINPTDGSSVYSGAAGQLMGDLVTGSLTGDTPLGASDLSDFAEFGPYEAKYNPDHGRGTDVGYGIENAIDSDPYGFTPYDGGFAVADAAGNDLLYVSPLGQISVLAVFPTIPEIAPADTFGSTQTAPVLAWAQAVPTAVAVGPDGDLYVGELGGLPFRKYRSSIYTVAPGQAPNFPTRYARGFTSIGDIAFDPSGNLDVLEIDQSGVDGGPRNAGDSSSGAIIQVAPDGTRTTLDSSDLPTATGMAIGPDGTIYVSVNGATPSGGEIESISPGGTGS